MNTPQTNEVVAVMDAETLEALLGSIAKWERVVADGRDGTQWKDCPLCKRFWHNSCIGCPVRERTGHALCRLSPFVEYENARDAFFDEDAEGDPGQAPAVIAAARDELDFLKSLLPKAHVPALLVSKESP